MEQVVYWSDCIVPLCSSVGDSILNWLQLCTNLIIDRTNQLIDCIICCLQYINSFIILCYQIILWFKTISRIVITIRCLIPILIEFINIMIIIESWKILRNLSIFESETITCTNVYNHNIFTILICIYILTRNHWVHFDLLTILILNLEVKGIHELTQLVRQSRQHILIESQAEVLQALVILQSIERQWLNSECSHIVSRSYLMLLNQTLTLWLWRIIQIVLSLYCVSLQLVVDRVIQSCCNLAQVQVRLLRVLQLSNEILSSLLQLTLIQREVIISWINSIYRNSIETIRRSCSSNAICQNLVCIFNLSKFKALCLIALAINQLQINNIRRTKLSWVQRYINISCISLIQKISLSDIPIQVSLSSCTIERRSQVQLWAQERSVIVTQNRIFCCIDSNIAKVFINQIFKSISISLRTFDSSIQCCKRSKLCYWRLIDNTECSLVSSNTALKRSKLICISLVSFQSINLLLQQIISSLQCSLLLSDSISKRNASVVSTVAFVICTRYESASSTHQEGREEQNTS